MMMMMKKILLLLMIIQTSLSTTTKLLVTRGVGAYVERECSDSNYAMSIRTKMVRDSADAVALDMGGYFWGPSIMTREQRLNLTSSAFVRSGYDAYGLNSDDLIADYENTEMMASAFFQ